MKRREFITLPAAQRPQSAVARGMQRYLALDDFETAARRRLPKMLYGFISGAAETDAALRDNRQAFADFGFVPRVLMEDRNGVGSTDRFTKNIMRSRVSNHSVL
jgi:L-lactate dehydrogenase (cytochrome)